MIRGFGALRQELIGFGKRGLLEKMGLFRRVQFSRDSGEVWESRDCREPPDCGKQRRIRPFSREIPEILEILEILEIPPGFLKTEHESNCYLAMPIILKALKLGHQSNSTTLSVCIYIYSYSYFCRWVILQVLALKGFLFLQFDAVSATEWQRNPRNIRRRQREDKEKKGKIVTQMGGVCHIYASPCQLKGMSFHRYCDANGSCDAFQKHCTEGSM